MKDYGMKDYGMQARRYTGPPTREVYPDDTLPGWLRDLRDNGSAATARSARLHGAERRTVEIAKERLDVVDPVYWRAA